MKTFAQFVSDWLHIKNQIASDLNIPESVIELWAHGAANPHPLIKNAVWTYLNEEEMKHDGIIYLRKDKIFQVENIICKFDPQGLIKMGAPSDEYSSESKKVTHHLYLSRTVNEFHKALWAIFVCSFSADMAGEFEYYEPLAKEIWSIRNGE